MEKRKAGRPSRDTNARELLIKHARDLFTVMSYDKVSIRLVAQKAGVNSALIRYYFGNKEGLFETMVRDTLAPMEQQVKRLMQDSSNGSVFDIMRTYYREMIKFPQFPRLIAQVMQMPASEIQRTLIERVFMDITKPVQSVLFDKLFGEERMKEGMDAKLCKVSYLSLMVFPFIAPHSLFAIHGIELNEEFLNQLLEHNIKMMTSGMLKADNTVEN
ncbi:TetR/AcrR family transcriptional regulator [Vibrio sp. LaRot3]|uniref:TetR/AcrR family transcriptional regulator n=1 Tax=Vibrio sp. LaRot3 TaxID=2998829 RepID=UPI0022CE0875|nr:TetR/AcrR family transcriptional regulator [Vibrio sp. LaRot3]MDA0150580.1 TetR/AcrR family transcriptional regulator [Vibrio sp. LaRot3]